MPTLQSYIDAASASSTITPPGGIYREQATVNKFGLTINGSNGVDVRGSDVWTGWTQSGSVWVSSLSVPNFGIDTDGTTFQGQHVEQVFLDNTSLTIVPSGPGASQFALDGSRHVLLGQNPAGHTIEVTTRASWLINAAANVTITNCAFRHAATKAQQHAIGNDDQVNWHLSTCTLSDTHGTMVSVGGGNTSATVSGCTITRGGNLGIGGFLAHGATISGNTISACGWSDYDPNFQSGGVKLVSGNNQTADGNLVYNVNGAGLWWDIACSNVTCTNNRIHDFGNGNGIHFEISDGASIHGNTVWSCQGPSFEAAIFSSSSANATIYNNVVYSTGNTMGIRAIDDNRGDKPANSGTGISIHDNQIIQAVDGTLGLSWWDYGSGRITNPASNNHGANNQFWYPGPEGAQRFQWGN